MMILGRTDGGRAKAVTRAAAVYDWQLKIRNIINNTEDDCHNDNVIQITKKAKFYHTARRARNHQ